MGKHRVIAFFVFMAIFTLAYHLGSTSAVSEEDAEIFMSEFRKLITGIDAFGIFTHNLVLALAMFVPGAGVVWGIFSAWSTGFAFAAISASTPGLDAVSPLAILFLSPFGLMELVAYSLGISRSYMLFWALVSTVGPGRFIRLARPTLIEVGIVVALLLAGGYVEYHMIEALQDNEKLLAPAP